MTLKQSHHKNGEKQENQAAKSELKDSEEWERKKSEGMHLFCEHNLLAVFQNGSV